MKSRMHLSLALAFFGIIPSLWASESETKTIFATDDGGQVFFKGKSVKSTTINTAIKQARGGDIVLILPGTYHEPVEIEKSGEEDKPVIIRGSGSLTTFACNKSPTSKGKAFFTMSYSKWITLENLTFKDCWPTAIEVKESQFITLRNISITGSHNAIVARGNYTNHLAIEDSIWLPDPSDKDCKKRPETLNGAMLAGEDLGGGIIFRRNTMKNAFSGINLTLKEPAKKRNDFIIIDGNTTDNLCGFLIEESQKTATKGDYLQRPFLTDLKFPKDLAVFSFSQKLRKGSFNISVKTAEGQKELNNCTPHLDTINCKIQGTPLTLETIDNILLPENIVAESGGKVTTWGSFTPKVILKVPNVAEK